MQEKTAPADNSLPMLSQPVSGTSEPGTDWLA